MHNITISKLNNNDDNITLLKWLFNDGQRISAGSVVAIAETSKATEDLICDSPGILHQLVEPGTECKFGDVIGYLFETEEEKQHFLSRQTSNQIAENSSLIITRAAQAVIDKYGITTAQLRSLGKKVIKTSDVEYLHSQQAEQNEHIYLLSRRQLAIADIVTISHNTIPTAFACIKIYSNYALEIQRHLSELTHSFIGMPELLIKVVSLQFQKFPLFFGSFRDKNTIVLADEAHVGVTIDVGKGLYIPVVKRAAQKHIQVIAEELMEFRIQALREAFREEDISGGNISISLNPDKDVTFVFPIILPFQTCMLSLGALQEELFIDKEVGVSSRSYFNLGIAYDHRAINGRDALTFLQMIKSQLESPEILQTLIK